MLRLQSVALDLIRDFALHTKVRAAYARLKVDKNVASMDGSTEPLLIDLCSVRSSSSNDFYAVQRNTTQIASGVVSRDSRGGGYSRLSVGLNDKEFTEQRATRWH